MNLEVCLIDFVYLIQKPSRSIITLGSLVLKSNNLHTAPPSNKQNPFFFRYKDIISLKTTFRLHKARLCPIGFGAAFAAVFALIYWLREFPLTAVANRIELRCKSKELFLSYYKICPSCVTMDSFLTLSLIGVKINLE